MRHASLLLLGLAGLPTAAWAGTTGTDELLSDEDRVPPTIIFLIDRSVTMDSPCDGSSTGDSCLTDVKQAIGDVVRHYDWANYGVIGTSDSSGDPNFYPIAPVGSSYAEIASALNSLSSSGTSTRNLSEALDTLRDTYLTQTSYDNGQDDDGDGFTGDWGESPVAYSCSRTYVIVLTRDRSTDDDQISMDASNAAATGDVMCDASGITSSDSQCWFDNLTAHIYGRDENTTASGTQRVVVDTVALGTLDSLADSLYTNAQANSGGEGLYATAATGADILPSMLSMLTDIQSGVFTRSSPVVTSDGAYMIYDFYEIVGSNPLAEGHVRAYGLDTDPDSSTYGQILFTGPSAYGGALWDGGDLLVSRPVLHAESNPEDRDGLGQRDIYTWEEGAAGVMGGESSSTRRLGFDADFVSAVGGSSVFDRYFDTTGSGSTVGSESAYNFTYQADGDDTIDSADLQYLVDFVRGLPTAKFRYMDLARGAWKLGDSPYAVPVVVTPRDNAYSTDPTYRAFLANLEADGIPSIVLVPANDGMLHAFALSDDPTAGSPNAGEELWAWVPGYLLLRDKPVEWANNLVDLALYGRTFLFDGSPVVEDVWIDANADGTKATDGSEWHRVVVVQQGLGGPDTLALDITDTAAPVYLWEQTNTVDTTAMGYTVGKPVILNVLDTATSATGHDRWVAMWGGGRAAAYTGASGNNYYQSVEPDLYMWNLGTDVWGTESRAFDLSGNNAGTAYEDLTTNGGSESWSALDMGSDTSKLEHAYISAALAAVDVDGDGDHDVVYFPVTSAYTPSDMGGVGAASPTVPGASWMYKAVFDSLTPDQPVWTRWYDPMDGTTDQGGANAIGSRPEVYYAATASWRSDGTLGIYWGSGSPFDRDSTDNGYFFAMYDPQPLDSTSTAHAIECDSHQGYYPLNGGEGLTSSPVVYAGVVYFSTYEANADRCEAGTGRIYGIRFDDCSPGMDTNGDGVADSSDDPAVTTNGYVSGVTVTASGSIYYGIANPNAGDEGDSIARIETATDPFLGTAAIAWMEMF